MRITKKHLQAKVDTLNKILNRPMSSYTKDIDGKYRTNIGNYHISYAYGGASLYEMHNDKGGIIDVFRCGHIPKRELAQMIQAFTDGAAIERNCEVKL
jgi:hypothetical protein